MSSPHPSPTTTQEAAGGPATTTTRAAARASLKRKAESVEDLPPLIDYDRVIKKLKRKGEFELGKLLGRNVAVNRTNEALVAKNLALKQENRRLEGVAARAQPKADRLDRRYDAVARHAVELTRANRELEDRLWFAKRDVELEAVELRIEMKFGEERYETEVEEEEEEEEEEEKEEEGDSDNDNDDVDSDDDDDYEDS